ncbi:hypothetical protein Tco_0151142 [Tanacetum coccineum]
MMDSWKKYTLGCKQKRQPQKENLSLLWIVAREKKLRKRDRGKAPEGRTKKDETGTTPIRSLTQESCKASQRAPEKSLPSKKTAISELEMIPSTMHYAVMHQSEMGPRVIMSEYQDIRICKQIKRLKESLPKAPLVVSECVNPE